jgi:hypothetical protein
MTTSVRQQQTGASTQEAFKGNSNYEPNNLHDPGIHLLFLSFALADGTNHNVYLCRQHHSCYPAYHPAQIFFGIQNERIASLVSRQRKKESQMNRLGSCLWFLWSKKKTAVKKPISTANQKLIARVDEHHHRAEMFKHPEVDPESTDPLDQLTYYIQLAKRAVLFKKEATAIDALNCATDKIAEMR